MSGQAQHSQLRTFHYEMTGHFWLAVAVPWNLMQYDRIFFSNHNWEELYWGLQSLAWRGQNDPFSCWIWILMIFQCLKYEHIYSGFNFNFSNKSFILRGNRLSNSMLKNYNGELPSRCCVNYRIAPRYSWVMRWEQYEDLLRSEKYTCALVLPAKPSPDTSQTQGENVHLVCTLETPDWN